MAETQNTNGSIDGLKFTEAVRAILSDGDWHRASEMFDKLGDLIRPETAYKRYALERPKRELEMAEAIRFGKWRLVQQRLINIVNGFCSKRLKVEGRGRGLNREYRLKQLATEAAEKA